MKLGDLQNYQVVSNPKTLSDLGNNFSVVQNTPPPAPQQSLSDKIWGGLASATNAIQGGMTGIAKGIASVPFDIASAGESILRPTVGAAVSAMTGKPQPASMEKPTGLTPQGTAETIGYGAEKIGEFFLPQSLFTKGEKAIEVGIQGLNIAKNIGGKIGPIVEGGTQLVARSLAEAGGMAGITALQGRNQDEIKRNAEIAGLIPIIGKGLSVASKAIPWIASVAGGLKKDDLLWAKDYPQPTDNALTHIAENPETPFLNLATTIKDKIVQAKDVVQNGYRAAVDAFKQQFPRARFDLNPYFKEFTNPLKEFPTLNLEQVSNRKTLGVFNAGEFTNPAASTVEGLKTGTRYQITKTTQSPFTQKEVDELNYLLNKIQTSRNIDIDNVIGLRQSFARAYDAVPLANGNPTPYHAAIMALKENAEKVFQKVMPEQLKAANAAYRNFDNVMSKVGNRIANTSGDMAQGAESYLSNLLNINKGQIQQDVAKLEEITGVPILDNIRTLKVAQRLSEDFPRTGSRTQDILRSLISMRGLAGGAAGFAAGGPMGAAAGVAATSPKVIGKSFVLTGKMAQELEKLAQSNPEIANFVNRLFGASLK